MYQFQKHFTCEEARALLPGLRRLFRQLYRHRDAVHKADATLGKTLDETGGDIGGPTLAAMVRDLVELNRGIAQLQEQGIVLKDFDRGLIDFPHIREGREVFLCWELDEDDIEFWHDIDAGYAGRERL